MSNKKLFWIFAFLAVIIVVAIVYSQKSPAPVSQDPKKNYDPKNPPWIIGDVVSVSGDQIQLNVGPKQVTVKITAQTKLVKQIADPKTKSITTGNAVIGDFKTGTTVGVYFSKPPVQDVYQADKVQIIK